MTTPSPDAVPVTAAVGAPDQPDTLNLKVSASPNFGGLLAQNNLSVLVSTYDAGKLIILRAMGDTLNVHFVNFGRTMGLAGDISRLAVGTSHRILELYNFPSLTSRLPEAATGPAVHDACFVLRNTHVTGNVDIHEMAWGGDELWFVNSRFSCLCTRDRVHSFVPRWRPPFIKGLSPEDRCHLNGLAMLGDRPGYVTAIGAIDEPEGWRSERIAGGIVMEVAAGEIIARGLSMPHSPRLYRDDLFVLNSGEGSMARIDRATGRADAIASFSGFTRGLDFAGDLAFVGLSQVRESKSFGGLPLTERLTEDERFCGIQILNLSTGEVMAYLKFESGVREIFAVHLMHGVNYPAILEEDDPLVPTAFALPPDALAQLR